MCHFGVPDAARVGPGVAVGKLARREPTRLDRLSRISSKIEFLHKRIMQNYFCHVKI